MYGHAQNSELLIHKIQHSIWKWDDLVDKTTVYILVSCVCQHSTYIQFQLHPKLSYKFAVHCTFKCIKIHCDY